MALPPTFAPPAGETTQSAGGDTMHRFGRSAQKKMNDRWGGAFILAVVLVLAGAVKLGGWLDGQLGGQASIEPAPGLGDGMTGIGNGSDGLTTAAQPREFQVHFVQVGAFRSPSAARTLAGKLSQEGFMAAAGPKQKDGLVRVFTGPYLTATAAKEAKDQLAAKNLIPESMAVAITVDHKPEAIMAMAGASNGDLQKGLDVINNYLYEASNWFAGKAAGQVAEAESIMAMGQEIHQYVGLMPTDNQVYKSFIDMANAAGENASAIATADKAQPGSAEFQQAMSSYVSLLDQYHSFYSQKASN